MLGNRVWAAFTFFCLADIIISDFKPTGVVLVLYYTSRVVTFLNSDTIIDIV